MNQILDGKLTAQKIREEIKFEVTKILNDYELRAPHCAVILVGDDVASQTYVKNKEKAFREVGMMSTVYRLPQNISQDELEKIVEYLNHDDEIDGILVQLPLPQQLDKDAILNLINPEKDVDGLTPVNQGLISKKEGLKPCTPLGIVELLKRHQIQLEGKHCVVIGRSELVGKPVSLLMLNEHCTVTMCHSKTQDLNKIASQADILIVAMGKAGYINENFIKDEAIVVDVGIHREEGQLIGDVNPDAYQKASWYTPVPGGVGPMTIAMLLSNTLKAFLERVHGA